MKKFTKLGLFLVLIGLIHSSHQQVWKNNKIVWETPQENYLPQFNTQYQQENSGLGTLIGSNIQPQTGKTDDTTGKHLFIQNAPSFFHPHVHPIPAPAPVPVHIPVPAPLPVPLPVPAHPPVVVAPAPAPAGPYAIQQATITNSGETIIENLIGGVPFNCAGKPTGHYRDTHFCDVFHACVFGQQRKSYSCPFVGEAQYFDDITRKCEFVRNNPLGCATNAFYH